jgi:hypothetical protein
MRLNALATACSVSLWVLLPGLVLPASSALAAAVPDLYSAVVRAPGTGPQSLEEGFDAALGAVLVKLTGERRYAVDRAARERFGQAASLVSRYQPLPASRLQVVFDAAALGQRLAVENVPVWVADRPLTLVWLADQAVAAGVPAGSAVNETRDAMVAVAAERGVPVVFAPDAAGSTGADPAVAAATAAASAGADLLLVGQRSRGGGSMIGWTLVAEDARYQWQGSVADGIHGLADRLVERNARSAAEVGSVRVGIAGIRNFDDYARLGGYLASLGMVETADLESVAGDRLVFNLRIRGSTEQLRESLLRGQFLLAGDGSGSSVAAPVPELDFTLGPAR